MIYSIGYIIEGSLGMDKKSAYLLSDQMLSSYQLPYLGSDLDLHPQYRK